MFQKISKFQTKSIVLHATRSPLGNMVPNTNGNKIIVSKIKLKSNYKVHFASRLPSRIARPTAPVRMQKRTIVYAKQSPPGVVDLEHLPGRLSGPGFGLKIVFRVKLARYTVYVLPKPSLVLCNSSCRHVSGFPGDCMTDNDTDR